MITRHRARRTGAGTIAFGLILVFVGGYYVLRNTLGFNLPELDSDQVVPVIAVILGLVMLYRAWGDRTDEERPA
jgi:O-antigen ligase